MSPNSSPQKSGIQSLDEYYEALELYNNALDRINSGGTGLGWSGIHYTVMDRVRRYGRSANGREDAVKALRELLREYERAQGWTETPSPTRSSDEEYLSKFDEDELG